jgi:methionyl-tRNA formyltransferase
VTDEQPGDVRVIDVNRILVIAGQQSALELLELQPAGKKRMSAAEFARGYLTQPGSRFGPDAPG